MLVITEKQGPVTLITINRPEVRNAVNRPTADAEMPPRVDQPFMNGIELVAIGHQAFQPVPLHHGRLEQGRRRVGVVLE